MRPSSLPQREQEHEQAESLLKAAGHEKHGIGRLARRMELSGRHPRGDTLAGGRRQQRREAHGRTVTATDVLWSRYYERVPSSQDIGAMSRISSSTYDSCRLRPSMKPSRTVGAATELSITPPCGGQCQPSRTPMIHEMRSRSTIKPGLWSSHPSRRCLMVSRPDVHGVLPSPVGIPSDDYDAASRFDRMGSDKALSVCRTMNMVRDACDSRTWLSGLGESFEACGRQMRRETRLRMKSVSSLESMRHRSANCRIAEGLPLD